MDNITNYDIVDHLENNFLEYAVSVITDRAVPDVRTGLKPSQTKILYTMRSTGLTSDKKTKKQHSVIGDCFKYYVHGDASVKDAMDRMAKNWILNEPLITPQGSVGVPDGISAAAAQRYLEIKLSKFGDLMTDLLKKDVVDMVDNYDGTAKEPVVLPGLYPNILVNASTGIAVGVSTSILPHPLEEACNAVIAYLKNNDITYEELIKIMPGPSFPLGGTIINGKDMIECYKTGVGSVIVRGTPIIDKNTITFTEFPYNVGTSKITEKILSLIEEGALDGVKDVNDLTGMNKKTGLTTAKIEIELERGANPNEILEKLYMLTPLQSTCNFNMVCLVEGKPLLLSLKDILKYYSEHLCSVHRRSLQFDLRKEEHDLHILVGIHLAIANIDEVIKTIKESKSKSDGLPKLMKLLNVDNEQAEAIWAKRLGSLSNTDITKVEEDIKSTEQKIKELNGLLDNLVDYVINSLNEIKKLGNPRKTKIENIDLSYQKVDKKKSSKPEVEEEEIIVSFNKNTGTAKRSKRGNGFKCSNLDFLYFFTQKGNLLKIQGYELPENEKGNITPLGLDDKIVSFVKFNPSDNIYHITQNGNIKGTKAIEYINVSKKNTNSIKLKPDDKVIDVIACDKNIEEIKITTSNKDVLNIKIDSISIGNKLTAGRKKIDFEKDETITKIELLKKEV